MQIKFLKAINAGIAKKLSSKPKQAYVILTTNSYLKFVDYY